MSFFFNPQDYMEIIKTLIKPQEKQQTVEEIDLDRLYNNGYRVLFLDLDNTLITYQQKTLSLQKMNWLAKVRKMGFEVFLVSNNSSYKRLKKVSEQIGVFGIFFALKPLVFGIKELATKWNVDLAKSVVVGDQLFTDIIAGNWLKTYTIMVEPMDKKVSFLRLMQRELEQFLLRKLQI